MREQGGGRIINISSINSKLSIPIGSLYCASKAALELFTDALRIELAPWGIKVILVIPGPTATSAHDITVKDAQSYLKRIDNCYAQFLERGYELLAKHLTHAQPPPFAARVILHAVTDPRPKLRYINEWRTWLKYYQKPFLPQRLIDVLLKRAFQIADGSN